MKENNFKLKRVSEKINYEKHDFLIVVVTKEDRKALEYSLNFWDTDFSVRKTEDGEYSYYIDSRKIDNIFFIGKSYQRKKSEWK